MSRLRPTATVPSRARPVDYYCSESCQPRVGAGRELTHADMIDVLITAGYATSSTTGLMTLTHPLLTRTGPNLYRVIGGPGADQA